MLYLLESTVTFPGIVVGVLIAVIGHILGSALTPGAKALWNRFRELQERGYRVSLRRKILQFRLLTYIPFLAAGAVAGVIAQYASKFSGANIGAYKAKLQAKIDGLKARLE